MFLFTLLWLFKQIWKVAFTKIYEKGIWEWELSSFVGPGTTIGNAKPYFRQHERSNLEPTTLTYFSCNSISFRGLILIIECYAHQTTNIIFQKIIAT
jgi:hypothetical protein